jgi:hypothetical protein
VKNIIYLLIAFLAATFLFSCQSKTKNLLVKKWDCVQIENLAPIDKNFATPQDSAVAIKIETALKALTWTFNSNYTYDCSVGNSITVQGTYEITPDDKTLILTPISKNNINRYNITTVSDFDLTLTSTGTTVPLILHFRPH